MAKLVSIIIPAFNQLHYCRQCVESIVANTDGPYRLILVDNGSTDGVREYFDSVSGAIALHAEQNLGFAGGVNLGLARAEGHVLLLNSDTLVPPGWLGRLVNALESSDGIGMVGPLSNCVSGSQQLDGLSFTSTDEVHAFAGDLAQRNAGRLRDVARLVGFCLLIREEAFKAVGIFDESYGIGNFEDDDYCLRV
ncbi:MAG: glycosyltransferase family 2 protein, partial [Candidatus Hydrogenedentes bacterium]|nr:glycosyltransferase family 2 protein [Candidatus Hydrogenedentota bacterium]